MADFARLKAMVTEDYEFHAAWRERAREDYDFFVGYQWDDKTRLDMEAKDRAAVVFNRVAPIIHAVAGTEINNRTEVKYIPRTIGDGQVNETLTEGARWFRDAGLAEEQESEQFMDALICGLGWTETTLDFETDEEGAPAIVRHDPIEIVWDKNARKKGLTDAKRVARVLVLDRATAEEMFPDKEPEELHAAWLNADKETRTKPHRNVSGDQWKNEDGFAGDEPLRSEVHIVQLQWRETEKHVDVVEPTTGQKSRMTKAEFAKLQERLPGIPLISREVVKHVWRQAFLGGTGILKENQPCADFCTFRAITANYDRREAQWYGLLHSMKDPQRWANKFLSQILHIINSNSKGGVFIEEGAVDPADVGKFEENYSAADAVQWLKSGGLQRIQEKSGPQFPAALSNLMEFAISSIRDASGVNMEILGMRDANQPGILEYQRKQSAMTTLAGLFDALRFYRRTQGEVILYYLRKYIAPSGRLVRLTMDGQPTYQPMQIDDDTVKYDVIVDDAPTSPNQKEMTWAFIEKLLPVLTSAGLSPEVWADILEHSPLPTSLVEKMKEDMAKGQEQNPMAEQAQQLEMRKLASEAAENEAKAMLDQARAQQLGVEAQVKPMLAMSEAETQRRKLAIDEAGLALRAQEAAQGFNVKRADLAIKAATPPRAYSGNAT